VFNWLRQKPQPDGISKTCYTKWLAGAVRFYEPELGARLQMFTLPTKLRRVIYVFFFELFGIVFSTILLMFLSTGGAAESVPVAVAVSAIAVVWNYVFNSIFEFWERRQVGGRSFLRRAVHAVLYEGGLIAFVVPLYMWWYDVGPWRAFTMELSILVFFLIYTFLFTLLFDTIFTLPKPMDTSKDAAGKTKEPHGLDKRP